MAYSRNVMGTDLCVQVGHLFRPNGLVDVNATRTYVYIHNIIIIIIRVSADRSY